MSTPANQDLRSPLSRSHHTQIGALIRPGASLRTTWARLAILLATVICCGTSIAQSDSHVTDLRRRDHRSPLIQPPATAFDAVRLRYRFGALAPTSQTKRVAAVRTAVPADRVCQAARQAAARQSHLLRLHQFQARVNQARIAQAAAPVARNQVHRNHPDKQGQ